MKKTIQILFTFTVVSHELTYFLKHETKGKMCYTENEVISILEVLIDNILVEFGAHNSQQIIGIHMRTHCAPLLIELFLYTYEAEFMQNIFKEKKS